MIINEEMTTMNEFQLSQQRLGVVTRLMEKLKREREMLLQQIALLTTSNNELSEYARVFHLDEAKEEANIEAAKEEAVESIAGLDMFADLNSAEDFASMGGAELVDIT